VIYNENILKDFKMALPKSNIVCVNANASSLTSTPTNQAADQAPPLQQSYNIAVNVIPGNILVSDSEVLINTTGADFDLRGKHKVSAYN